MISQKPHDLVSKRPGERGAALITAILLSTLLLAAGGTLILTTALTGTTAVASTSEIQAYYAAEAGVARSLNVLRGNENSNPAGTRASFLNVVSTPGNWTTTSGNSVNVAADGSSSFRVTSILDPDDQDGSLRNAVGSTYKPTRLRVRVAGFGPNGAQKNMEFVVNRFTINYPVNSTITLPNQSGNPMNFNLGGSNVTAYSGVDAAGNPLAPIAAFGIDNNDYTAANNVMDGCAADGTNCSGSAPVVTPVDPLVLSESNTPSFLQSVSAARGFLYGTDGMMAAAVNEGRYFTSGAAATSSSLGIGEGSPDGALTFVDGDLVLSAAHGSATVSGRGTLIVTGTLTLDGNFEFDGVIMVLGTGTVRRSGSGHGDIYGALFVAKFDRTGADTDLFQAPTFDTSGGGTANIQYNSDSVDKAKGVGGHKILGIREF
jgi:hypothetical protein